MSENVTSTGLFGKLITPIDRDDSFEAIEELYDTYNLNINYEGTLVFSDEPQSEPGIFFGSASNDAVSEFISDCQKAGFPVIPESVRPYTCTWYNGSDSDMSELTVDEFDKRTAE